MATQAQRIIELEAALAESEAARIAAEKAAAAAKRKRFSFPLWINTKRERVEQPPWQSCFRFVVPTDLQAGDPIWLDVGLYDYDPKTCPLKFDPNGTLPEFIGSISATDAEYAATKEEGHQKYKAEDQQ